MNFISLVYPLPHPPQIGALRNLKAQQIQFSKQIRNFVCLAIRKFSFSFPSNLAENLIFFIVIHDPGLSSVVIANASF